MDLKINILQSQVERQYSYEIIFVFGQSYVPMDTLGKPHVCLLQVYQYDVRI